MDLDRRDRAKRIFCDALDLSESDRTRWIESECGDDPEMRAAVESLLHAHERADGFLDNPLVAVAWTEKERIRIVPARVVVVVHRIPTYACPECPDQVRTAPGPSLVLPKSPVRQAIEYALSRRASFMRYLDGGVIEIDNHLSLWACERCMRAPAIGRRNWLFGSTWWGSADGGETAAWWMTIIQSARLHEVDPFASIASILDRLAEFRDLPGDRNAAEREARMTELLPDAWITRHPEARLPLAR